MSKRELTEISSLPAVSLSVGAALSGSFSAQPLLRSLLGGHGAPWESPSCGLRQLAALPSGAVLLQGCRLSSRPLTAASPPACSCLPLPPANTAISSTARYESMIFLRLACSGPEEEPAAQLPAAQRVSCEGPQRWLA